MIIQHLVKPAYAVICNPVLNNCTSSTAPKTYFNNVLSGIISIFMLVGVIYFVWHIVFAGYHLISTQGDPKSFETAKNEIVYSFIGLVVLFSVFAILKFIGTVLGIPGLNTLQIAWPSL
jgi:hypothetical protein